MWSYGIIYLFTFFYLINIISAQECFDDGNKFCIDKNDLLSVNLLPGSLFINDQTNNASKTTINAIIDGSFDKALNEMDYHRLGIKLFRQINLHYRKKKLHKYNYIIQL